MVDILSGRVGNPRRMNPYLEGNIVVQGLHQLVAVGLALGEQPQQQWRQHPLEQLGIVCRTHALRL